MTVDATRLQRIEGAAIAGAGAFALVDSGAAWWWLLALFLVFDLSMLGYVAGPRVGAHVYNLGHLLIWPAVLAIAGAAADLPAVFTVGCCWAFHIGVDRLLGYGFKSPTGFRHTHLSN